MRSSSSIRGGIHTTFVLSALVLSCIVPVAQAASAQCADPRGNSACANGGQVTFNPPPGGGQTQSQPCADPRGNAYCQANPQPAQSQPPTQPNPAPQAQPGSVPLQSNPPAVYTPALAIDPPAAAAGATISVAAANLAPGRSVWINLSHMKTTTGLSLGAKQLATADGSVPTTAADGSLLAKVSVPAVPGWTAGSADICILQASPQPVCTPFTLLSAEQANDNTATTPDAIVGHYQCSSATLIGFGGGFCTGAEPVLALNADATYVYGQEQGNWSFDGTTVSFDGSLGSATVLNRRLTIDSQVDMPDGSGTQAIRYFYIRMNY